MLFVKPEFASIYIQVSERFRSVNRIVSDSVKLTSKVQRTEWRTSQSSSCDRLVSHRTALNLHTLTIPTELTSAVHTIRIPLPTSSLSNSSLFIFTKLLIGCFICSNVNIELLPLWIYCLVVILGATFTFLFLIRDLPNRSTSCDINFSFYVL